MKKLHLFRWLCGVVCAAAALAFPGCSDNDDDPIFVPTLDVSPTELKFDEKGGAKTFEVVCDGMWKITGAEGQEWLALTPETEGSGNRTITVTVGADQTAHSVELKVTSYASIMGVLKEVDTKTVKVEQTPGGVAPVGELIWSETCGTEALSGSTLIGDYTGWTKEGMGAAEVTYTGTEKTTVRASGLQNQGSGHNEIFFGTAPTSFTANGIALAAGQTALKLTFISSCSKKNETTGEYDNTFDPSKFKVSLSKDGEAWTDIEYTVSGGEATPYWVSATSDFPLAEAVDKLYIRFLAETSSVYRLDDMKLETGPGGQTVNFGGGGSGDVVAITIPEIIAKMTAEQTVLDASADRTFEAVIVTDKQGGNVNNNNLQVMTPGATTAGNGITLYGSGKYTNPNDKEFAFAKGDKVKVTLKAGKARIVNYQGLYEVTGSQGDEWCVIEKIGTQAVVPVTVAASDLASFQGMCVTVKGAKAPATAAVWCEAKDWGTHTFTAGGSDLTVFVQANMPGLVGTQYVADATGDVTGYATVYKNNAQICPQTVADVNAFLSSAPAISAVTPDALTFEAAGATKEVNVSTVNAEGCTLEAAADNTHFTVSVAGDKIAVTAPENTTEAAVKGTLTVRLMKDGAAVDTKTVAMTQAKPASGDETVITADFSVKANYPADFPELSANKKVDAQAYVFGGHEFTFVGSKGNGYYMAYDNTDPYVINGKEGAYIELPAVEGKSLATVTLTTRTNASKSVMVGVYDAANNPVAGGEAIKLEQLNGQLEYTYDLVGTTAGEKYRIYIASKHNAQFVKLELAYN